MDPLLHKEILMQVIAHAITFDFWNTLATPSKQYAEERTKYLSQYGITKEDYKTIKNELDALSDTSSLNIHKSDKSGIFKNVLINNSVRIDPFISMKKLFDHTKKSRLVDDEKTSIYASYDINRKFMSNPPSIKDPFLDETFKLMDENKILRGIISNTNFISGSTLTETIPKEYKFDVMAYSDLVGISKPNPLIYYATSKSFGVNNPGDIMIHHIGDNLITDVEGPQKAGYKGYHIKTKQDILETVKRIIEENNLYETKRNILVA